MYKFKPFTTAGLILLPLLPISSIAQEDPVYVDISPCMAMQSDESRYNCYDLLEAQIRAAKERESSLPVVSIQRNVRQNQTENEQSDEVEVDTVASFGTENAAVGQNRAATARVLENADGEQELVDLITLLDMKVPNQWEITLASGQVWRQINSKRFRLREGMEVRIYPSPFRGSFRLSASNINGFIQVRRIQ